MGMFGDSIGTSASLLGQLSAMQSIQSQLALGQGYRGYYPSFFNPFFRDIEPCERVKNAIRRVKGVCTEAIEV